LKQGFGLSVITPVCNNIRFIESCIKNVICQNCPDVEHVIIDGGSADGTVEIIRKYAEKYSHINWISENDNGQSDAMNKGILMAKKEIISFLNVDDFYEPGALNFVLGRFGSLPEPSLLVGNCSVWNDEDKILWINKPKHLKLEKLLVANESYYPFPVNPSAYFYHKSLHDIIGMYDLAEHYVMDIDFILKAVKNSHTEYADILLGNYRFIEGTKTFLDSNDGSGDDRFKALINKHIKSLRLSKRLTIYFIALFVKHTDVLANRFFKVLQNYNIAK